MAGEDAFRHADARRGTGPSAHKLRPRNRRADDRTTKAARSCAPASPTPTEQGKPPTIIAEFLGDAVARPLRFVEAPGHAFADARKKPNAAFDKYVSLINRASIEALEEAVETPVDPLRFRANVYFDGPPSWRELDWIGSQITLGGARLRVVSPITRCAATEVNPDTAERDLDTVAALRRHFGHNLMGIYAEVTEGGPIAVDDTLTVRG